MDNGWLVTRPRLIRRLHLARKVMAGFQPFSGGRLTGYKVMGYDPSTGQVVSGANARLRLDLRRGAVHRMPGKGIFLGSSSKYVLDYYAVFEYNALLTYSFDPSDVTSGSLTDREPEITVSEARVEKFEVFDEDLDPIKTAASYGRASHRVGAVMEWTVYLFSDTGRVLWEKTYRARDERDAERQALKLVKPHINRFDDAEDWVFEPAGKRASVGLFDRIKVTLNSE